ncbi:kinase-like domain-containing protein, partial [Mycotypha africana]|uniref:kinase-like domain-containing protein n=1 Tax=Mycotypha africana TaxID=64632 RepID=UPI002300ACF9
MMIKEIGRGMHGKVKLAEDLDTGELVAIKIVDKQARRKHLGYNISKKELQDNLLRFHNESEQKIRKEMAILRKCAHPNVVRLKEVIDDPKSRKIYLALEYMEGGEIIWHALESIRYWPVLTMEEARHIFRDVVCGLDYLHYQGIIHRDIKPANLLYATKEKQQVKISDFGVSYFNPHLAATAASSEQQHTRADEMDRELAETAGTPAFFAPELCSSLEQQHQQQREEHITKAIDVWALGVTLYCLIYGRCPFTAATEFELFDIIPTQPLTFPTKEQVGFDTPDTLQHLLHGLLAK